jgi:hypothetical protein
MTRAGRRAVAPPGGGRAPRLAAGLLALAVTVSACGTGSTLALGRRSVSACYLAIPVARAAVHDRHARLQGVHRLAAGAVENVVAQHPSVGPDSQPLCVVALVGPFGPGQVSGSAAGGRYALVLVSSRDLRVVGIRVLDRLPHRFRGRMFRT